MLKNYEKIITKKNLIKYLTLQFIPVLENGVFLKFFDKWFPSSQLCSYCGANTGKKELNIRKFDCPHCNTKNIDRDINALKNILKYGLGMIDNRNTEGTVVFVKC
jgi:putative transposase